eukprot:gene2300-2473_t
MSNEETKKEDLMEIEKKEETPEEKLEREKKEAFDTMISDVKQNISLIKRGVQNNDDRLIGRALRQNLTLRRKLDKVTLCTVISQNLPENCERKKLLLDYFKDIKVDSFDTKKLKKLPEVEVFLQILLTVHLIDTKRYEEAVICSTDMIEYIKKNNRNTLFLLGSKAYFYYSRSYELTNQLSVIRSELLKGFKTSCLKQDKHGQAVLMNLLLRNYIEENLYDQANQLISKSPSIDFHSNSQLARYFYYKGRIKSIQLDYSLAYDCLMQAIMKSPTGTAKGFRTSCYKLMIIVKLLMGEIPERSVFTQKGLKKSLEPYYDLTKQVRVGDLLKFRKVVEKYSETFKSDQTYSLVQRIRQNVIRTGLKKISISYSKISLKDICEKLNLETPEDVEHIVAKAIRDGIIDASINHQQSYIKSNESIDIYSTSEPSLVFENRIEFCLKVHNDSVKSLRFPSLKKQLQQQQQQLENSESENVFDDILDDLDDDEEDGMDEFGGL